MDFKPSNFLVGVIDFFAVLLPGALFCYLIMLLAPLLNGYAQVFPAPPGEAAQWVGFLFASYLSGHLVFLLGSLLDYLYDPLRKLLRPRSNDQLYIHATTFKVEKLGAKNAELINTFRWAKAVLELRHPKAVAEINRLEADSKFFRSLIIVLPWSLAVVYCRGGSLMALGALAPIQLLIGLASWRYGERRWKSTRLAYEYLIASALAADADAPVRVRAGCEPRAVVVRVAVGADPDADLRGI